MSATKKEVVATEKLMDVFECAVKLVGEEIDSVSSPAQKKMYRALTSRIRQHMYERIK